MIKTEGDRAVLEYEEKFDKVALTALAVTEAEQAEAEASVGEELKKAIRLAKRNIETFHAAQRFESKQVETQPGVTCWQKAVAIEKVGLYIPRWNSTALFHRADAGSSSQDCRM